MINRFSNFEYNPSTSMSISSSSSSVAPVSDMFSEFDGKVRMDEESQRFSVLDIISVMTGSTHTGNNSRTLTKVCEDHESVQNAIERIRINDQRDYDMLAGVIEEVLG